MAERAGSVAGHRRRLRERFLRAGLVGLQDYEALELLLMFAIPRRDVKPLAKLLLERYGSVEKVLDAPPAEQLEIDGIGPHAATLIVLLKQLCTEYLEQKARSVDVLDSTGRVVDFLRMKLGGGRKETFMVLFLNTQNHLITYETYPGTVDRAPVYAREIAERALLARASGVIAAHNHPSGVCDPSPDDIRLTRSLAAALSPLGISLFDHIIVTPTAYRSLKVMKLL